MRFCSASRGFALGDAGLVGGDGHHRSVDTVGFGVRFVCSHLRRRAGDAAGFRGLAELEAHRRHDQERNRFHEHQYTDELLDGFEMQDEIAALLRREKAATCEAHGGAEAYGEGCEHDFRALPQGGRVVSRWRPGEGPHHVFRLGGRGLRGCVEGSHAPEYAAVRRGGG